MDRKKLRSLISDKTPLAAVKCPVCGQAPWSWYNLLEEGEVLECADCGTRWKWDAANRSETWNIPAVFRYYRLEYVVRGESPLSRPCFRTGSRPRARGRLLPKRACISQARAGGEPVIVDIFRMAGDGGQFTWASHGRTGELEIRGVEAWREVEAEAPLRKARQADSGAGTVEALWRFPGPAAAGLRLLLPNLGESSIISSECPPEEDEIMAAHLKGGTLKPGAVLPYRGHIQVKKRGPAAVFAAVYVPFAGSEAPKAEVTAAELGGGAVALRIDIAGERFVIIHGANAGQLEYEGVVLDGRVGVVSWRGGKLEDLTLGEGRALSCAGAGIYRSTIGNGFRSLGPASPGTS